MRGRSRWVAIREAGEALESETTPLAAVQALPDVRVLLVLRDGVSLRVELPDDAIPVYQRLVRGQARVGAKAVEPVAGTEYEHAAMAGWVAADGRQALVWWLHDGSLRLTENGELVDD